MAKAQAGRRQGGRRAPAYPSLLLLVVVASSRAAPRSVLWYTSAGDATQVQDALPAATGFYMCCGKIKVTGNGSVHSVGISELLTIVQAAGRLPVQHTIAVDANVTWDGAALISATDAIADLVVSSNASGAIVDYEVPADLWKMWGAVKTRAVANGYVRWASVLAKALHAKGRTLGLDLSGDCGGSPIDLFDVFAANATVVDQLSSHEVDLLTPPRGPSGPFFVA